MVDTRRLLTASRKRLTSAMLTHCEQAPWYRQLNDREREALRNKVLDAVGVYHDNVLDVIRALEGDPSADGITNQKALELLEAIWSEVRPIVESSTAPADRQVTQERPFLAPVSGG